MKLRFAILAVTVLAPITAALADNIIIDGDINDIQSSGPILTRPTFDRSQVAIGRNQKNEFKYEYNGDDDQQNDDDSDTSTNTQTRHKSKVKASSH